MTKSGMLSMLILEALISSNENNFETIQKILYSPETTFNPGEIVESRYLDNDKPIEVTQENLSPSAIQYIVKKKINIRNKIKKMKIKNSISDYALFDEILNDKIKRSEKR